MIITIVNSIYNTYVIGQAVHLNIPPVYGMFQANQLTGIITDINGLNFSINIDSTGFDSFVAPSPSAYPTPSQPASLAPAGCKNIYDTLQEPFHSLTTQGN